MGHDLWISGYLDIVRVLLVGFRSARQARGSSDIVHDDHNLSAFDVGKGRQRDGHLLAKRPLEFYPDWLA